jgi:hypothetical protein
VLQLVVQLLVSEAAEVRVLGQPEQAVVLEAVDILLLLVLQELEPPVKEIMAFKETMLAEQTVVEAAVLGALERVPVYWLAALAALVLHLQLLVLQ